jgi:hypothetical protein
MLPQLRNWIMHNWIFAVGVLGGLILLLIGYLAYLRKTTPNTKLFDYVCRNPSDASACRHMIGKDAAAQYDQLETNYEKTLLCKNAAMSRLHRKLNCSQ